MALRFGRCRRLKLLDRTAVAWLLPPLCLMSYRFTVLDAIGEADRAFALLSPLFERLQEQGRFLDGLAVLECLTTTARLSDRFRAMLPGYTADVAIGLGDLVQAASLLDDAIGIQEQLAARDPPTPSGNVISRSAMKRSATFDAPKATSSNARSGGDRRSARASSTKIVNARCTSSTASDRRSSGRTSDTLTNEIARPRRHCALLGFWAASCSRIARDWL